MYKYETHLHTSGVSGCAKATVKESLEFYKKAGYDGVFITNHFIEDKFTYGNYASYEDFINFQFSDYEEGVEIGKNIGIKVFCGMELSLGGTDFLVYGLDKKWYLNNQKIMDMKMSEKLLYMIENGALVIQAHPFREDFYIDHIRLFPRSVHGIEIINARRAEFENNMAKLYAQKYELLEFAGSDNHNASGQKILAGVHFDTPLTDEGDFIKRVKNNETKIFVEENTYD